MLSGVLYLSYYGYYGGTIGEFFQRLEEAGFFSYLLPFLLIFAIVFGVLQKIKAFSNNKAVVAIISVVVGLIAANTEFVSLFFSQIFPQLGVGLAILLVAVILLQFFFGSQDGNWTKYIYFGIGVIIFLVIMSKMSDTFGGIVNTYWWDQFWPLIIGALFIIALIAIISKSGSNDNSSPEK